MPKPKHATSRKRQSEGTRARSAAAVSSAARKVLVSRVVYKRQREQDLLDQYDASRTAALAARRAGTRYLACLADGDSWFNYECGLSLLPDLKHRLEAQGIGTIVNLAFSGQTLSQIISGEGLARFTRYLRQGLVEPGDWSVVLISAGGDDVANNGRFMRWLNPFEPTITDPESYISEAYTQFELPILHEQYRTVARLVHKWAPEALLFVHAYDYAIPNGRCVRSFFDVFDLPFCLDGPWLQPAFDARGFPRSQSLLAWQVVKAVLQSFESMLRQLAQEYAFVRVVPTQGTLGDRPHARLWANELHPTDKSFEKLAGVFQAALRAAL